MTSLGKAACAVVVAASVLLTGCVSTVGGTAVRARNAGSVDVPPLDESALDDVMLSIGELNGIVGSTTMKITSDLDNMTDQAGGVSEWEACADSAISVDDADATYLFQIDDLTAEDNLITQMTTQEDSDGWTCQHALSVVSNLTVEAWACGYSIRDEAATIATEMIANAAKK